MKRREICMNVCSWWQGFECVNDHASRRPPVSHSKCTKMPFDVRSDCLVIPHLHQCEMHVCVCVFLSTCVWACTHFSHGLRKCRGVMEVALLEYVGRLLFLSLSLSLTLSWKVYFCCYRIRLEFLFLDSAFGLPPPPPPPLHFPLILITSSVIGPLTGHTVAKGNTQTHTDTSASQSITLLENTPSEPMCMKTDKTSKPLPSHAGWSHAGALPEFSIRWLFPPRMKRTQQQWSFY